MKEKSISKYSLRHSEMMIKLLCILIPMLLFYSGCALQSDVIYIDDRVDAIEKKMSKQNMATGDAEKGLITKYARLSNQIDKLDEMIRRIKGRFEEIDFALKSQEELIEGLKAQNDTLASFASTLEVKIKNLESYTGYNTSDETAVEPVEGEKEPDENPDEVKSDDVLLYDKGKTAFDKGKLKTARKLFLNLIKEFPGSDKADNAQFWIGEIYYKSKKYKTAILEYQKVIDDFPTGNKVAGAYLKQALAFEALGEPDNAKIILNDLIKQYPESGEAIIARKKISAMK